MQKQTMKPRSLNIARIVPTIIVVLTTAMVHGEYCPGHGAVCPPPQRCCHGSSMCCTPIDPKTTESIKFQTFETDLQLGVWNLWYFWFVVIFLFMACTGACAFWRHRRRLIMAEQAALATVSFGNVVPPRRYHCPPLRLSPEVSRASLNRFSYFSTVLASSPSSQDPQGEFPSPPPYTEIATKLSEAPGNSYWKGLPPYPGGSSLDIEQSPPNHFKETRGCGDSASHRSSMPTSPPSYSTLPSTTAPPDYAVNSSKNRSSSSFPSLSSTPSVNSDEELIPQDTERRPPP